MNNISANQNLTFLEKYVILYIESERERKTKNSHYVRKTSPPRGAHGYD